VALLGLSVISCGMDRKERELPSWAPIDGGLWFIVVSLVNRQY